MPPPGPDLAQVGPVAFFIVAHLNLSPGEHEDTCHALVLGGFAQYRVVLFGPVAVDIGTVRAAQRYGRDILARLARQAHVVARKHPDIDIQPQLVRAVARSHRPAPRLADIPDIETVPTRLLGRKPAEVLHVIDRFGVPPVAIARQSHRLPRGTGLGQLNRSRPHIRANNCRTPLLFVASLPLCPEQLLCQGLRCGRVRQRGHCQ